jgi:hypothetical protein
MGVFSKILPDQQIGFARRRRGPVGLLAQKRR